MLVGFERDLTVEHGNPRHALQLIEQLFGVQRLVVLDGQALKRPVAVLGLTQAQIQTIQLHMSKTNIAV